MVFRRGEFLGSLKRHSLVVCDWEGVKNFAIKGVGDLNKCSYVLFRYFLLVFIILLMVGSGGLGKSIGGRSKFRFDEFCGGFGYHFSDGFSSDVFRRLGFIYFSEYFLRFSNGLILFLFWSLFLGGKV